MGLIDKSTGNPVDPNTPVNIVDFKGNVSSVPASQADKVTSDPNSYVKIASPQETQDYSDKVNYGGTASGLMTAGAGAINTATAGILPAITDKVMGEFDPQGQPGRDLRAQKRQEQNPYWNAAGQIGGFMIPGGAADLATQAAGKLTGLGEKTFAGALTRVMAKTAQNATAGGLYGLASNIVPNLIANHPLSADSIADSVIHDAIGFGAPTFLLSAASEGIAKSIEIKNDAAKYLKKGAASIDPNAPQSGVNVETAPIDSTDIPRSQTPAGKGTTFSVKTDPLPEGSPSDIKPKTTYTYNGKDSVIKIDADDVTGNGYDFTNKQNLQDIGQKHGINDFDIKYENIRRPGESSQDFLTRSKEAQVKYNWLTKNEFALSDADQGILMEHDQAINDLKADPTNVNAINSLQATTDQLDDIVKNISSKPKINTEELNQSLIKQELEQMKYEVKNAERNQGLTTNENGEVNGRFDDNTYPKWYKRVKPKNAIDFENQINKGKGAVYNRAVEEAKVRLENGYKNITSGEVMPNADYSKEPVNIPNSERELLENKLKQVKPEIKNTFSNLDHVKEDGSIHILNPDVITGDLTKASGEALTENSNEAVKKLNVKEKVLNKTRNGFINTASGYINDLFPKSPEDLAPSQHEIDYVADKNSQNLTKFGGDMSNVITRIENTLDKKGISTNLKTSDLANFIDTRLMDQYLDPKTGNPYPETHAEYLDVKNYADNLRKTGFTINKYGNVEYQPMTFSEMRAQRLRLDSIADYRNNNPVGMQKAAEQLRNFIEQHTVKLLGDTSTELSAQYVDAKKNYHMAKTAETLIDGASVKAANKGVKNSGNVMGAYLGSKIGGMILGKPGAIIGGILGLGSSGGYGILSRISEGSHYQFMQSLTEAVTKHDQLISRAAFGILSKKESSYPEISQNKNYTYDKIKKDEKMLNSAKNSQVEYYNNYMTRNAAAFSAAPQAMNNSVQTAVKANNFLLSKVPQNPYASMPWRADKWEPNQQDITKYFRYKEAVESPQTILKQLQSGYITPEASEVLTSVYPATKEELKNKIVNNLKGDISQEKRITLFKVFGLPLDNYSHGQLFTQMQGNAANMIVQEQQNDQMKPINSSKITDPMAQLSQGNQTIQNQD